MLSPYRVNSAIWIKSIRVVCHHKEGQEVRLALTEFSAQRLAKYWDMTIQGSEVLLMTESTFSILYYTVNHLAVRSN